MSMIIQMFCVTLIGMKFGLVLCYLINSNESKVVPHVMNQGLISKSIGHMGFYVIIGK